MAARSQRASTSGGPAPKSDVYTGLLLISLLAQLVAVLFFWLDWSQYPEAKPKEPPAIVAGPAAPAGPAVAPAPGPGPAPAPAPVPK